jgi:undecaprenyl-diphosphatase
MDIFGLIQNADDKILDFIQLNMRNPACDKLMPLLSFLGNWGMVWIIAALVFIILKKHRQLGINLLLSLLLCTLIGNTLIKPLVERVRPCNVNMLYALLIARPEDFSFPSGHTTTSFGAAVTIFYYNKKMGVWAFVLAALIAFSRLYLYVHYPSDVLAGALLER